MEDWRSDQLWYCVWWVVGSLKMSGRLHWVDREDLHSLMFYHYEERDWRFCRQARSVVDPFHILLGIAVLEDKPVF